MLDFSPDNREHFAKTAGRDNPGSFCGARASTCGNPPTLRAWHHDRPKNGRPLRPNPPNPLSLAAIRRAKANLPTPRPQNSGNPPGARHSGYLPYIHTHTLAHHPSHCLKRSLPSPLSLYGLSLEARSSTALHRVVGRDHGHYSV